MTRSDSAHDWTTLPHWDEARVVHVDNVHLPVGAFDWPLARNQHAGIEAGWAEAVARNPGYFNGVIHLMRGGDLSSASFEANLFATDFKTYLFWRESGFADRSVRDCFGSALIRSAEGHVVLGRQRAGNVNGGLTYLPGGFIDGRDVVADPATGARTIDIDASILREISEETGLDPSAFKVRPGYYLTFTGPQISLAREVVSHLSGEELRAAILAHIATDPKSELIDIIIARDRRDIDGIAMPRCAEALLGALFL